MTNEKFSTGRGDDVELDETEYRQPTQYEAGYVARRQFIAALNAYDAAEMPTNHVRGNMVGAIMWLDQFRDTPEGWDDSPLEDDPADAFGVL